MAPEVEKWIAECPRCLRRKFATTERAPMVSISTTQPLELVSMDFLTHEPSKGNFQHVLVITDHFTRYSIAVPTRHQTAKTTAESFVNNFVVHSDQGANFQSKIMKELYRTTGISQSKTTPYHPQGNGQMRTIQPDTTEYARNSRPLAESCLESPRRSASPRLHRHLE